MRRAASILVVGSLSALVVSCAPDRDKDLGPCPSVQVVTVVNTPGDIQVSHDCVKVRVGQSFTLQLQPPREPRKARTRPAPDENAGEDWLMEENYPDGERIVITAPMTLPACEAEGCKYEIEIDDVGVLDPRVRVTN